MSTVTNIPSTTSDKNILETAAAKGSFKTFGKAVEQAGMGDTLRGTGPFTVFAPTDAAFEKLPAGRLEVLFKPENKQELVSLLNYHVVNGRKSMADVGKWEAARTVNGQSAPVKMTTATSGSSPAAAMASHSAWLVARLSALRASGRFSVTVAT
jgi:uncharacterized surface protein with fasciclin (FAS1) repeats